MAAFLDNEDLNGSCFIAGELGEVEELRQNRIIVVPTGINLATQPFGGVQFTAAQGVAFLEANFLYTKTVQPQASDLEAAMIAWLRFLVVRNGLASDQFAPANFFVTYNECVPQTATSLQPSAAVVAAAPRDQNLAADRVRPAIQAVLTNDVRARLRRDFSNLVCCVAYLFRVRGHHWLADMQAKYVNLWRKCLKNNDDCGLKWEWVAHDALHAIFPLLLDQFWQDKVRDSNVAGALQKRLDSAPAGVAGVRALEAGMMDLASTVPGFKHINQSLYDELDRLLELLKNNRWAGSINRRFYQGPDLGFFEGRFSGIASTIVAALEQFAPTSQLRNSMALKRMAQGAPISGGFTAQLIAAAAKDSENAKALVRAGVTI